MTTSSYERCICGHINSLATPTTNFAWMATTNYELRICGHHHSLAAPAADFAQMATTTTWPRLARPSP